MKITKETITAAVEFGLEFFGPASTVSVPLNRVNDVQHLRTFLGALAAGQLAIQPVVQKDPEVNSKAADATP